MGRTLIGGSAVASPTTSSSSSSSTATAGSSTNAQPPRTERVEGYPLIALFSSQGNNANAEFDLNIEALDSYGRQCTVSDYNSQFGGSRHMAYNTYSSTYSTAQAEGYAGSIYADTAFVASNPSTSNWHNNIAEYNNAGTWTQRGMIGGQWINFDLDYNVNAPSWYVTNYNTNYNGGATGQNGGSVVHSGGSWIGAAGTRQDHALLKVYQEDFLYVMRHQRTRYPNRMYDDTRMSQCDQLGDRVGLYDYFPDTLKASYSQDNHHNYMTGTRISYNENLNRMIYIMGYSTSQSNNHVITWQGATGKNLYDTSLKDWMDAATATYHGTIASGMSNTNSNQDAFHARVWLLNNGNAVLSWKQSSTNRAYLLDVNNGGGVYQDGSVAVLVNYSPSGSTTSYYYDQGQNVSTHMGYLSWDQKWLWLGWVYYYYHCGMIGLVLDVDTGQIYAKFDRSESSQTFYLAPYGPSGFMMFQHNEFSGNNGYACVFSFDETAGLYEEDNTKFKYKQRVWNYASGVSAYSTNNYERITNPSEFDIANGMVMRTNINIGGTLDNSCSTWQMHRPSKQFLRIPTGNAQMAPLQYWYQTLPNGLDNRASASRGIKI